MSYNKEEKRQGKAMGLEIDENVKPAKTPRPTKKTLTKKSVIKKTVSKKPVTKKKKSKKK